MLPSGQAVLEESPPLVSLSARRSPEDSRNHLFCLHLGPFRCVSVAFNAKRGSICHGNRSEKGSRGRSEGIERWRAGCRAHCPSSFQALSMDKKGPKAHERPRKVAENSRCWIESGLPHGQLREIHLLKCSFIEAFRDVAQAPAVGEVGIAAAHQAGGARYPANKLNMGHFRWGESLQKAIDLSDFSLYLAISPNLTLLFYCLEAF